MKGFFGLNCLSECLGGNNVFCNGLFLCDILIGMCNCLVLLNIIYDCSVCSLGWIGLDCFVLFGENRSSLENFIC